MPLVDDISVVVNVFVALGTILLAIYAYRNIKITQSQLKSFQEQTSFLLSQNRPILEIGNCSVDKNKLKISLKNVGNTPAFELGVSTYCFSVDKTDDIKHMKWLHDFGWPYVTERLVKDIFRKRLDQTVDVTYYDPERVLDGEKTSKYKPIEGITFLKRPTGDSYLLPSENWMPFEIEPVYMLDDDFNNNLKYEFLEHKRADLLQNYKPRRYTLEQIAKIYLKNELPYICVKFSLYCKDSFENEIFVNDIDYYIIDLKKEKSIEEGVGKPRLLAPSFLSHPRLVKEVGYQPRWIYSNLKWRTVNLTESDREEQKKQKKRALYRVPGR
ncbi:hypothetical protein [Methanoregula boonei]|jgi:hypothetical protein|nr:hypothetical protein [Methanoregula boonei]